MRNHYPIMYRWIIISDGILLHGGTVSSKNWFLKFNNFLKYVEVLKLRLMSLAVFLSQPFFAKRLPLLTNFFKYSQPCPLFNVSPLPLRGIFSTNSVQKQSKRQLRSTALPLPKRPLIKPYWSYSGGSSHGTHKLAVLLGVVLGERFSLDQTDYQRYDNRDQSRYAHL